MKWLLLPLLLAFAVTASAAETLQLEAGSQRLVPQDKSVSRVAVGNPEVADVNVIRGRDVLLTGKKPGRTTLLVWPSGVKAPKEYAVVVGSGNDPALVTRPGSVNTQVQTDIKVAELSRSTLRQFGFNYALGGTHTTVTVNRPGASGSINTNTGAVTGQIPLGNAFNLVFGDASRGAAGIFSLLEQRGMVRVLAEPTLVAMSGQTASFLAGGEFPVPVQQGTSGGGAGSTGAITIEFKEFGVRLNLTPTVLANDRIVLRVAPEVSELNFTAGVRSGGVEVPALTVRRTETTVELGDGESFFISGLVSQNTLANVDKLPYLGSLPIIGAFFRSNQFDREDKELVMLVTPHLVKPIRKGAPLPALPGAAYQNYNPSNSRLIFLEQGDFDPAATGFSR
ncbi:MAG TPA: type II and III secretion system protein family protein [Nevskiales bacterium]|nr:type II and III secretion system protein family protein [Nevskiales bacterium]